MGTLYVVATPIGNLGDITPRAEQTLRDVALIAAEDTRHTKRLLRHLKIDTPTISYHQHNERERVSQLLDALSNGDVALVSDAGTPAVSDPGAILIRAVRDVGIRVVPIPGPSALVSAIAASGLVDGPFLFGGFLPRGGEERDQMMRRARIADVPLVLFESPNRLVQTLDDLLKALGDVQAVVARELTKVHEETRGGSLSDLAAYYRLHEPRGEICLVVEAAAPAEAPEDEGTLVAVARRLLADGTKPSKAARELARIAGVPSNEAYDIVRAVQDREGS